ncbi:hypothetical protein [Ovoidimarina sediminis]|uniref:hypothetical protein n=1 Tax=Ovoidimarina sediminis TaxID=3079856 RepID=UPI002911DA59|nr:hypothetical protein [Rhodophyticola sp. MJ-SS7]MDU8944893.1 hypothetical protein [Rhodophyticola sp. MJ-SS7]
MAAEPFSFERRARRPFGLAMVTAALLCLSLLIFAVDAHPVIVALFAVVTGPAVWDVFRDARATLQINDKRLAWNTGHHEITVPLGEIREAVLSTSFDFSQRGKIHLSDGRRLRIPPQCMPGGRTLDAALELRAVPYRRSLFGN